MQFIAKLKSIPISAQKARLVANEIRKSSLGNALVFLEFSSAKASSLIFKLLKSCIDNATYQGADIDDLIISSVTVDGGSVMKRVSPRAKGRADRILKRTCHVTIILRENLEGFDGSKG